MRYLFSILKTIIFTFGVSYTFAQPPKICPQPPAMTSFCEDACIICDIDGYTGRHDSKIQGFLPPDFCTSTVHNAQWIAFIAGSENLRIELSVSNCNTGWGLEMTIYETRDCKTFEKVFNCDGDVQENSKMVFTNRKPLTIGQYYYLAMDGNGGDNCDWTFKVLEGTTEVSPLENSGELVLPEQACELTDIEFKLDAPVGATEFYWSVNNNALSENKKSFNYSFARPGNYNVCVYAANACDQATPVCKNIEIKAIPVTTINQYVCGEECLILPDTTICEAGNHQLLYPLAIGCDSVVNISLEKKEQPITNLAATICSGDSIVVNNRAFTATNEYEILFDRPFCDSIVELNLRVIECNIEGQSKVTDALCYESSDGSIRFTINQGTPPFTYAVKTLENTTKKTGKVALLGQEEMVSGLEAGFYLVEINDEFGNSEILLNTVAEPTPLQSSGNTSDYNSFNVSCFGGSDGEIEVKPSEGTPPYTILWSDENSDFLHKGLKAGFYTATVTDANGCPIQLNFTLNQPEAINLEVNGINPACEDLQSGTIVIQNSIGGLAPYQYELLNSGEVGSGSFARLRSGTYYVQMKDVNNCLVTDTVTLRDPEIPVINATDEYEIELGDSLELSATTNLAELQSVLWSGQYDILCDTCLETYAYPYTTTSFTLTVASFDDCKDEAQIRVKVKNGRYVFFPNIFNSQSTTNNTFTLVTGKGVKEITRFDVYDRWGNLVHSERNILPNANSGWDGKLKNQWCETGVYVWLAEITYLDDTKEFFNGDITLLK